MIIFDLDTLADNSHRRHFVEKYIACDHWHQIPNHPVDMCVDCKKKHIKWEPDWTAYNEACDKDELVEPTIKVFEALWENRKGDGDIVIWSGRCESTRPKTEEWLFKHIEFQRTMPYLRMRPIGDNTPEHELKEKWLLEFWVATCPQDGRIDFVFDSHPDSIAMFRKRGIFVFDCRQDKEF